MIRDVYPESHSRIQGSKRHRIPDPRNTENWPIIGFANENPLGSAKFRALLVRMKSSIFFYLKPFAP
jgi:hypothetical protein